MNARLEDSVRLCQVSQKVDTVVARASNALLESLPRAKYASYKCERPDKPTKCFEGTRTGIIETIGQWIHDPNPASPNIYFMNGIAGVGKTTIARTIAEQLEHEGLLGADIFFSRRGEVELRDPVKVFPTIAYRLAQYDTDFSRVITEALDKDPQAPYASLEQQLDRLIIQPLKTLNRDPQRTVFVLLDAVDECQRKGTEEILRCLVDAIPFIPFLKVFITGRPEEYILSPLTPSNHLCTTRLHDIDTSIVRSDIRLYLRATLAALPKVLNLDLRDDWIASYELDLLADKSDNLFIYAVTVARFISDDEVLDPRVQLDILLPILEPGQHTPENMQPFRDLDALYMQLLLKTLSSTNSAHVLRILQLFLGTVVLLRDPLPQAALEKLAGLRPGQANAPLRRLQSVILSPARPDDCPRIYHPSFQDFMQDPARCTNPQLCIASSAHEARMAVACLTLITETLPRGTLDEVDSPAHSRNTVDLEIKIRLPEIQYSCRFWAAHLMGTLLHPEIDDLRQVLKKFTDSVLLTWLVAMRQLGETHLAMMCLEDAQIWVVSLGIISTISAIQFILQAGSSCDMRIRQLLNEAYLLLLSRFSTITDAAVNVARKNPPTSPHQEPSVAKLNQVEGSSQALPKDFLPSEPGELEIAGDHTEGNGLLSPSKPLFSSTQIKMANITSQSIHNRSFLRVLCWPP